MNHHEIHWFEGQLICPQHFQSAERRTRDAIRVAEEWVVGYAYGLREFEIDHAALGNWQFRPVRCHARLKDGTPIRFPEDAILAPVPISKDVFSTPDARVTAHLAVPRLELGRVNVRAGGDGQSGPVRYALVEQEVEDENQPGAPVPVQFRLPQARILLGDDELDAYESIPVARLRLGATDAAAPRLDPEYIPPLLACDAWTPLVDDLLKRIYDHLAGQMDENARKAVDQNVSLESGHPQDPGLLWKLDALNSAVGWLHNLWCVRGVHPLHAYLGLCRIVGQMAVFRRDWGLRFPDVPRYDHDDLGGRFHRIWELLRPEGPKDRYEKRVFRGQALRMQVTLDPAWLAPGWRFFLGVESKLSFGDVERLLRGQLNLKVASSEDVDNIFTLGYSGVELRPEGHPPRVLPGGDWTYWIVDRHSPAWKPVERKLELGIRFNERQVVDGSQGLTGQERVQIRGADGRPVALTFALFAVPNEGRPAS